jgi:hypothetical protein
MPKTGQKLTFDDVGVELIVTVGGDADVVATATDGASLSVGKRYSCATTGIQVLITKPGAAQLQCGGELMVLQEPKKTKAAD